MQPAPKSVMARDEKGMKCFVGRKGRKITKRGREQHETSLTSLGVGFGSKQADVGLPKFPLKKFSGLSNKPQRPLFCESFSNFLRLLSPVPLFVQFSIFSMRSYSSSYLLSRNTRIFVTRTLTLWVAATSPSSSL